MDNELDDVSDWRRIIRVTVSRPVKMEVYAIIENVWWMILASADLSSAPDHSSVLFLFGH